MQKKIGMLLLSSVVTVSLMAGIPSAKKARTITNKATQQAYSKLMSSKKGKEVYNGIMKLFEKNIMKIAKEGFYDSFVITIYNSDKIGIEKLMKKLSRKEQDMLRQKVIEDLKKKGYKVTLNQYWDNPDNINISVSW